MNHPPYNTPFKWKKKRSSIIVATFGSQPVGQIDGTQVQRRYCFGLVWQELSRYFCWHYKKCRVTRVDLEDSCSKLIFEHWRNVVTNQLACRDLCWEWSLVPNNQVSLHKVTIVLSPKCAFVVAMVSGLNFWSLFCILVNSIPMLRTMSMLYHLDLSSNA